jgi:hypothetical protein
MHQPAPNPAPRRRRANITIEKHQQPRLRPVPRAPAPVNHDQPQPWLQSAMGQPRLPAHIHTGCRYRRRIAPTVTNSQRWSPLPLSNCADRRRFPALAAALTHIHVPRHVATRSGRVAGSPLRRWCGRRRRDERWQLGFGRSARSPARGPTRAACFVVQVNI